MSEPLRSDVDLQLLFRKLGHDVDEIRVRSLGNILSKLSHGLICEADLVQERHLLVRLLEWFNFSQVPCQEDVLNLVYKLAKYGSSAQIFVELGAVRFLSQLRPDCSDSLHPLIDDIIETLLSLPSQEDGILHHKKECVYQTHQQQILAGDTEDMVNNGQTTFIQEVTSLQPSQGYFAPQESTAVTLPCEPAQGNEGVRGLKFCTFPWLSLTHTDRHVLLSTNSLLCSSRPSLVATSCEFISDVVLQDFPAEIFLQRPSIVKSLLSLLGVKPLGDTDAEIPVGAARCLRDLAVLIMARYRFYHDPSLYCPKQEFGSVPSSSYTSSSGRASQATSQSTLSSNSRPSVIGRNEPRLRGDGQDRDSPSSVGSSPVITDPSLGTDSETDSEDALSLQFSQLTLPQFVVETMSKILPVLKTANPEVMLAGMQLLEESIKLMQVSMTMDIWEDKSVAGRYLTEKLLESLESLGEAIEFHHEHSSVDDASALSIQHHKMAYIVLAAFTLQVLQAMVPLSKCRDIVPDSLISGISLLVMDQSLVYSIPQARTALEDYLEKLESEKYQVYRRAMDLCRSLESCQSFLKEAKMVKEELLPLASVSLTGLPYHPDLMFVKQFIKVYSQICRHTEIDPNKSTLMDGRKTLLKLLAHPEVNIRVETYKSCANIIKKCVNVEEAAKPHSDASLNVRFLADPSVLYEISCYGLNDANKEICNFASDIVLHLLQGKLLMHTQVWQETIQAIVPSMPVLQVCRLSPSLTTGQTAYAHSSMARDNSGYCTIIASITVMLARCTSDQTQVKDADLLNWNLKFVFEIEYLRLETHLNVRHEAARCVLWHLTQDPDRGRKLPSVSNPVLTDIVRHEAARCVLWHLTQDPDRGRKLPSVSNPVLTDMSDLYLCFLSPFSVRHEAARCVLWHLTQDPDRGRKLPLYLIHVRHEAARCVLWHLTQDPDRGRKLPSVSNPVLTDMSDLYLMEYPVVLDDSRERSVFQVDGLVKVYNIYSSSETEPSLKKSAAEQIAIMLQDVTLHKAFISSDGMEKTLGYLKEAVNSASSKQAAMATLIPACVSILRHVLHEDSSLRHQLAHQSDIYYLILRCTLLCKSDSRVKYQAAHLMVLLLFDEAASLSASPDDKHQRFALPRCVIQSTVLHLGKTEHLVLRESLIKHSLSHCLTGITQATSHHQVKLSLWHLSLWLTTGLLMDSDDVGFPLSPCGQFLLLEWKDVLKRFVEVVPANSDDKLLLTEVLRFLTNLMQSLKFVPEDLLDWLGDISCGSKSVLMTLLSTYAANHQGGGGSSQQGAVEDAVGRQGMRRTEEEGSPHTVLHKQLLMFFNTFVKCLPLADAWRHKGRYLGGGLTHGLLTSLNMTDALPFYDLPPLEGTLNCLVHVTARSGWSLDWNDGDSLSLCQHLLNSLVEVVSAFHVGRGGTAMSYMGKGVTKNATLCLQHLTNEMAKRALDQDWSSQWFQTRQGKGLDWLMALWTYRDPESIKNKFREFQTLIQTSSPSICALTETWLNDSIPNSVVLQNYSIFRSDRPNRRGGGVLLALSPELDPIVVDTPLIDTLLETKWVSFTIKNEKWLCGVVYRPKEVTNGIQDLETMLWELTATPYSGILVVGDFNINWNSNHPLFPELANLANANNLHQLVNQVTCPRHSAMNPEDGTMLDLLFTSRPDRICNVRAAGLCIAASLTSTLEGCVTMATSCQHLPAGLWGVAFGILLDQSECSMVREQAGNLLCNLLSKPFSDPDTTASTDQTKSKAKWSGPQVHDEQSQVSLSGQPALLALLHHYHFYHGVANMLQHYYGQCTIQPVSVVEESSISTSVTPSGPSTVTTPGSNRSNRSNASTPSMAHHTWPSDIHSTSLMQSPPSHFVESGAPVPNLQGNMTEAEALISPSPSAPSSHPHATTNVGRFSSVVTPCLVSAVCRVLRNLMVHVQHDAVMGIAKEDILASLLHLFNSSQILELFHHYHTQGSTSRSEILQLQLAKCLSTYTEIVRLVKVCEMLGSNQSMGSWDDEAIFNHCLQLLLLRGVEDTGGEVWVSVSNVWEGIFDMMTVHLQVGGHYAWQKVLPLLGTYWKNITDSLVFLLKNPSPSKTRISALNFISMALSKSGSNDPTGKGVNTQDAMGVNAMSTSYGREETELMLGEVLDAKSSPKDSDCDVDSYGGALCEILLQAYDGVLPRSTSPLNGEKAAVLSALKNLLASSCEAQLAALKGGLVESTVNCMKDIHSKLSMESLHINNKSSKKKEEPLLCELSDQVHLLDCFMLGNTDVKMAAYQAGLTSVIRKLWAWCTSERKLLARVLSMLATYVARCPTACSSLTIGPPGQTGGSLLHNLVRQCQREKSRMTSSKSEEYAVADKLFAVLGNAVWSSECRNVLWKSGFLQGFTHTLPPKKKKLTSGHRQSAALWLRLMCNLTFATEGQQMVLKIAECLDVLMEFGQCKDTTLHYLAVVVLHNLCFLNANKAKLLATDNLVEFLLDTLQSDSIDVQLAVLNALWALVHNCQKAKAVLKATTLLQRLLMLQGQLRKASVLPSSVDAPYISKCQQIAASLQILIQD
ncbi:rotatin-like [Amphiura filiformis]|uniref:rotatin-like n=1 Tax=Amphiura filiformis TaxID=82378 RepID=UPI003B21B4B7